MKIKKLLTPLLLILLLTSIAVFGAPQPMGPYFDDTYLEYGNDGLNVKTATVTDGDTTHVPTSDNVYDFCETTQNYAQATDKLSYFAATTSAELAGVISDETGTLKVVLSDSPVFTTKISTPQVTFPASQSASADANTLDDYEEGTYNPTLTCSVSGSYTLDANSDLAGYIKVGKKVTVWGRINVTGESSPDGVLRLSLPFTSADLAEYAEYAIGNLVIYNHGGTIVNPYLAVYGGTNYASFSDISDSGTVSSIDHDRVDTAFAFYFTITYLAAD